MLKFEYFFQLFVAIALLAALPLVYTSLADTNMTLLLIVCGAILFGALKSILNAIADGLPDAQSFKWNPAQYHGQMIELSGIVTRVLSDSIIERTKRRYINWWRTRRGNTDSRNRYIHTRFFVRSDQLRRGERVFVEHNIHYDAPRIVPGLRVQLRGQYLHKIPGGRFGVPLFRYGRIHKTHPPDGYLKKA